MIPVLALAASLCSSGPFEVGVEVQRNLSSRGTAGLENLAIAEAREDAASTGRVVELDSKAGVTEYAFLASGSWARDLGGPWTASAILGLGWAQAAGDALVGEDVGYRWTIDAPLVELGGAVRRSFGAHWSAGAELAVSRAFLGSGKVETLPSERTLDKGEVGESGTFLEDLDLAWRLRLKIGPRASYGRFSAFPWVGLGNTAVMTSDSRIAGFDADEDADWIKLGLGLRLGWSL